MNAKRPRLDGARHRISESDVGQRVLQWLSEDGWDCYPEAQFYRGGARADIAAVRNGLLWIIECKTTFGDAVVTQAWKWMETAHFVSVAIPTGYRSPRSALREFCHERDISVYSKFA